MGSVADPWPHDGCACCVVSHLRQLVHSSLATVAGRQDWPKCRVFHGSSDSFADKRQDGAFLADDVLLSPAEFGAGTIRIGMSSVGAKTFVGNSAIVDPDIHIPDASLIGVLSTAPKTKGKEMELGSSWLGRAPMSIPRRIEAPLDPSVTFAPPMRLVLARALVESCRLLPLLISAMLATLVGLGLLFITNSFGVGWAILGSGGLLFGAGVVACTITTAAKWLVTPVIRPGEQHPLWSSFVWRNELADTFVQSLAVLGLEDFAMVPLCYVYGCALWGLRLGVVYG